MSLLNLPDDLLLFILNLTSAEDLVGVMLACRSLYSFIKINFHRLPKLLKPGIQISFGKSTVLLFSLSDLHPITTEFVFGDIPESGCENLMVVPRGSPCVLSTSPVLLQAFQTKLSVFIKKNAAEASQIVKPLTVGQNFKPRWYVNSDADKFLAAETLISMVSRRVHIGVCNAVLESSRLLRILIPSIRHLTSLKIHKVTEENDLLNALDVMSIEKLEVSLNFCLSPAFFDSSRLQGLKHLVIQHPSTQEYEDFTLPLSLKTFNAQNIRPPLATVQRLFHEWNSGLRAMEYMMTGIDIGNTGDEDIQQRTISALRFVTSNEEGSVRIMPGMILQAHINLRRADGNGLHVWITAVDFGLTGPTLVCSQLPKYSRT